MRPDTGDRVTVKNPEACRDYGIRYPVFGLTDKKGDIPCDRNMQHIAKKTTYDERRRWESGIAGVPRRYSGANRWCAGSYGEQWGDTGRYWGGLGSITWKTLPKGNFPHGDADDNDKPGGERRKKSRKRGP